jgi:hypothetical protein
MRFLPGKESEKIQKDGAALHNPLFLFPKPIVTVTVEEYG